MVMTGGARGAGSVATTAPAPIGAGETGGAGEDDGAGHDTGGGSTSEVGVAAAVVRADATLLAPEPPEEHPLTTKAATAATLIAAPADHRPVMAPLLVRYGQDAQRADLDDRRPGFLVDPVARAGAPGVSSNVGATAPMADGEIDDLYVESVSADEADADAAVSALYRSHAADLVGMIWAFLGDRPAAEDITQEAFLRLRQRWGQLRDRASAPAYLRSTAFNLARSGLRHHLVVSRHAGETIVPLSSAEEGTMLRADQQEVADALRSLPPRQRACLVLRYYADMTDTQIAEHLGLSASSVKTHIARGLARLTAELEDGR